MLPDKADSDVATDALQVTAFFSILENRRAEKCPQECRAGGGM